MRITRCLIAVTGVLVAAKKPNIIFVLFDDLGWSDVSWTNKNVKSTPFMANLINNGTELTQAYATHRCTPSRAGLLTGRYPFRYGLGSFPISRETPTGLNLNEKLLPEFLKELGYSTHAVGKWHLGHCNASYLPNSRGFDQFYGHLNGAISYTEHTIRAGKGDVLDFFHNKEKHIRYGEYTTDLFGEKTLEILETSKQPAFIYLAFNAPHEPTMAPSELIEEMRKLHPTTAQSRLEHLASVYHMDRQLEKIVALSETLDRETIFIIKSDNGGAVHKFGAHTEGAKKFGKSKMPRACNFPYKGYKNSLYEGGTLSPAFIYSTKRQFTKPRVTEMFHIIDWFPTILDFAGYKMRHLPPNIDGVSQRKVLKDETYETPRTKFIYGLINQYDQTDGWKTYYAARFGKYKYFNYNQPVATYRCDEPLKNDQLTSYIQTSVPQPEQYWQRVMDDSFPIKKLLNKQQYLEGARLYNLETDPFEMYNLLSSTEETRGNGTLRLIWQINKYFNKQIAKGHQLPAIPGDISGKLFTWLAHNMYLVFPRNINYYFDTGRVVKDINNNTNYVGSVGTDWCHDGLQRDRSIFEQLAIAAIAKGKFDVAKDVQILLDHSSLFS